MKFSELKEGDRFTLVSGKVWIKGLPPDYNKTKDSYACNAYMEEDNNRKQFILQSDTVSLVKEEGD